MYLLEMPVSNKNELTTYQEQNYWSVRAHGIKYIRSHSTWRHWKISYFLKSVFWDQYRVCLLHNFEHLNSKTLLTCTSWHQLDVRCYVNFKIQKFRFEKILYVWPERRKWLFCRRFFSISTYRYSVNILRGVMQNC